VRSAGPRPGRRPAVLALAAILLGLAISPGVAAAPGWRRLAIPATGSYALRYLPPGLDTTQPAPAVVFLHGSGATPEQWQDLLSPVADQLSFVLVLPAAISGLGFGVGADDVTVAESLRLVGGEVALDPTRVAIGGHSAGGAYAIVLAYGKALRFSGVFSMSAPYRTVLAVADPDYAAPLRFYYGTEDPNYQGGSFAALGQQANRLGVPWEADVRSGYGHSTWPEESLVGGFAFLLAQRYGTAGGCVPADTRLCLRGGRFAVEATWTDPRGHSGPAQVTAARTSDSGLLWFFQASNWELQVKVLDGCPVNGHYWVFAAGTTNVGFSLRVRDLVGGGERAYDNPVGQVALSITDVGAFATCP
jgi:pimeloyl-ACP methyl ester carboxylesterase